VSTLLDARVKCIVWMFLKLGVGNNKRSLAWFPGLPSRVLLNCLESTKCSNLAYWMLMDPGPAEPTIDS